MIGIDIIEIKRIQNIVDKYGEKFLYKIFTSAEISYCQRYKNRAEHFAVRFAAKEAVAKVIKKGPVDFWKKIEIGNNSNGEPYVILSQDLQELISNYTIEISLSHCKEYAIAMAILA